MPRELFEDYYSEEEFHDLVDKLNAVTSPVFRWCETKARKRHADLFSEEIQNGEIYYQRKNGMDWGDAIKLSRLSMERFLYAAFSFNPILENIAANLHEQRFEQLRKSCEECDPLKGIIDQTNSDETSS
ncbi:MAG: hypothetical protein ACYC6Z_04040 [Thermoleophilia bacterium]